MNTPIKVPSKVSRSLSDNKYSESGLDAYRKREFYKQEEKNMSKSQDYNNDPLQRVAVFLDGSNFFYMQKDALRWFIDPKKLLNWLSQYGEITDANYYTTVDNQNEGQLMYLKALNHMGFRVETKPIDQFNEEDGFDGSVDLDMLIDMLVQIDNYDMAIIISGDADFARIVEVLRARGKDYLVLSTKGMVASAIRNVAGVHYKDIAELRSEIEKD
jgi:uncharacterized LabA/DUF88 family protein